MDNSASLAAGPYDDCFFTSKPSPDRHIDRLSLLASLCGIQGSSKESPQVLEIGCSTGQNLISLALSTPHINAVGIDSSPKQIDAARKLSSDLGLSNLRFDCVDINQLLSRIGQFDFIICHGLFSWVPRETQQAIFRICRDCLTDDGVAYVSFNSEPGWSMRGSIAKWLRTFPSERGTDSVSQAKERLELLKSIQVDDYSPSGIVFRDAINHLLDQSPALFTHETLNPYSNALSLTEFMAQAVEYGLDYLADSAINHLLFLSPAQLGITGPSLQAYAAIEHNVILKEQMWDLLHPRILRKVLLCRASLTRSPVSHSIKSDWYVAAPLQGPVDTTSLADHAAAVFESPGRGSLEVTDPLVKAALSILSKQWPLPLTLRELSVQIEQLLGAQPGASIEPCDVQFEKLSSALFPLFVQGIIEITCLPPQFSLTPSDRPYAHPLARKQSEAQSWVSNYRNEFVALNNIERSILRLLDGTKTVPELQHEMRRLYDEREILLTASPEEIDQYGGIENLLSQLLDETVTSFGQSALLRRDP